MSKTSSTNISVGFQHKSQSMLNAFSDIYKNHGIRGLYRGVSITLPRGVLGSGTQLATFGYTKEFLRNNTQLNDTYISLGSGFFAGTAMVNILNPYYIYLLIE